MGFLKKHFEFVVKKILWFRFSCNTIFKKVVFVLFCFKNRKITQKEKRYFFAVFDKVSYFVL